MTATMLAPIAEPHTDEFLADDWETTELPVPVTDQATAAAEPPATATPPENSPNNPVLGIEAFLYKGDPVYDPHDSTEPLYVRTRCYAPQLHPFLPRDQAQ